MKFILALFVLAQIISFSFLLTGFFYEYNVSNTISAGIVAFLLFIFLLSTTVSSRIIYNSQTLLLMSLVSWCIAEAFYGYYEGILEIDPYPSVADFFYLAGSIFFLLFFILMNRSYKIELAFIASSIITFSLIVFYVIYIAVFIFDVYDYSGSIFDLVLLFAYPIIDVLIMIGAITYYFRGRSISLNKDYIHWIFVSLFAFFSLIADITFGYNNLVDDFSDEILSDLCFNIGYLLLGVAVLIRMYYLNAPKNY
ncbi:hypothetical protein [Candidatus Nitrosocosmicus arcticus]|uniref:Uncharacterized protein n=1 Tax=Candidatus Nitrosocosmicus arcticus TaxID=2035267 RepID=A0A557STV8_9ARCH|nr:hypothetical protein [Candidatus Nitrosocosmicus arcticus]TVP40042.1 membrane protein of unknown function [Candidatus Nitrosocosmicus arcticus]